MNTVVSDSEEMTLGSIRTLIYTYVLAKSFF